jgi:putative DNA primase/helicase
MNSELFDAARWYARRGMAVFPLHYPVERDGGLWCSCGSPHLKEDGTPDGNRAKHPYAMRAKRGLLDATTDLRQVERWWGPGTPYNIGLRTGACSGIIVIDVDPRHGGDVTLTELEERNGSLPETRRHITGSGGQHILFLHPGRTIKNNVGTKLGPGLDIRGDGGYIVAPPSRHITGRLYLVATDDDVALAEAPPWLLAMIWRESDCSNAAAAPEIWHKLVAEGVAEGCRNDAVARLTGLLMRPGPKDPHVVLDLMRCWNAQRCNPPLSEDELVRTVRSVCSRELARQEDAANV